MRSSKKKKDENQIAASIIQQLTSTTETAPAKNPAAVALGRLGGLKGGKARAAALSSARKREIAIKAVRARWAKTKRRKR